jgi:hypothetical protein
MAVLFLAAFIGGLVFTVFAMLNGVERRSRRGGFAINRPTAAGFAIVFGAVGYPLVHYTALSHEIVLIIACAAGAVGAGLALALVAAWAIPSARAEVVDERFLLQGSLARVVSVTDGGAEGTIVYEVDHVTHSAPARGLDGIRLDPMSEVVIERVEDGVAYVEPWARVEARL